MPIISQTEFAKKCGVTRQTIKSYIDLGKLVLTDNRQIDEDNEINKEFFENRNNIDVKDDVKSSDKATLERRIREAELKKKEQEITLNEIKIQKQRGESIPIDLVDAVFAQLVQGFITEFDNIMDRRYLLISKETGMDVSDISRHRSLTKKDINSSVDKVIDETKKNMDTIISEVAEQRGKGEKK